ncbi:heme-binding Shp domain-containing protein [Blautia coccoides]|uniref:heme-binding Shp domain-containing protein n=2 Tax=Blautia producta TaxID=33035 RepID=UPI0028A389A6|nr:heme-binding Shp domain-containing protein [Blautia coccoides]MDT4371798.1 heme-binding Shp domain-containing protein [Blautia coccoides]
MGNARRKNAKTQKGNKMKALKIKNKFLAGFLSMMLALFMGAGIAAVPVYAASGTVYTCVIHPCYAHPVTGEIEDSGGEASYATGQGMVDGAVYTSGILEVTDSGEYYLTIRMSLMSYTSGHSFWVQNVGDSGWSSPAMGVTGNGTDNNGATNDICIQVPSENCVVRASMYVEPMGRDVIFYLYPSDYAEGNNTDMNATMVTSASGSDTAASGSQTSGNTDNTAGTDNTSGSENDQSEPTPSASALQSQPASSDNDDTSVNKDNTEDTENTENSTGEASKLESSIKEAAAPSEDTETPSTENSTLNSARGLSLSTAGEAVAAGTETLSPESGSAGKQILVLVVSITISGLILLGAVAGVVYLFRKNWYRWGSGDDDDE